MRSPACFETDQKSTSHLSTFNQELTAAWKSGILLALAQSSSDLQHGAALLLAPLAARAQFRGDVFFATPSASAPAGGVAMLQVQLFSGADVDGATHLDILFGSTRAQVVAVEPGTTAELVDGVASATSSGRAGIVPPAGLQRRSPAGKMWTLVVRRICRLFELAGLAERLTPGIRTAATVGFFSSGHRSERELLQILQGLPGQHQLLHAALLHLFLSFPLPSPVP